MTEDTALNEDVELDTDPAAEAFARLEGEMALMRRAVEHLAAERADIVIPDYGATLAEMTKRLGAMTRGITTIAEQPAMQLTPDSIGHRIAAAAELARRTDHDRISQAQNELHHATQNMRAVTAHARTAAEQRRRLFQAAGGGVLAGILLWSFLPGTIARAVPDSWHWPERMATAMLSAPSPWDAGFRLMSAGNPNAADVLLQAAVLQQDNGGAIAACRIAARAAKRPVRCTIRIGEPTEVKRP